VESAQEGNEQDKNGTGKHPNMVDVTGIEPVTPCLQRTPTHQRLHLASKRAILSLPISEVLKAVHNPPFLNHSSSFYAPSYHIGWIEKESPGHVLP